MVDRSFPSTHISRAPVAFWLPGIVGLVAWPVAFLELQCLQFQVVNYECALYAAPHRWPVLLFTALVFLVPIVLGVRAIGRARRGDSWRQRLSVFWPLGLAVPFASYFFAESAPPFAYAYLLILAGGWAAFRALLTSDDGDAEVSASDRRWSAAAVASIVVAIALLTLIHTRLQIQFFEHFMLGHSDFGHFTEELKNVLAGRGLRSDSFDNTRLGWHFVPLLYLLVPGYALWPSPVYLMVCGAFAVHVAALPAYFLAKRRSDSVLVGWLFAVAWLLLPSLSRLVYSNTYGFQWIYVAIPLIALMLSAAMSDRWRFCWVMVVVVLLCKETTTALTLGLGLYLLLFSKKRRAGVIVAIGSIAYLLLCTQLLIPHFSVAERYERMDLFGELGGTVGELATAPFFAPGLFFERLFRLEGVHFAAILLAPMGLVAIANARLMVVAVPTFLLILLLKNEQWLSIKFWHQATILPVLFFAGIGVVKRANAGAVRDRMTRWLGGRSTCSTGAFNRALAVMVVICAACGHSMFAFSPVSRSYEAFASAAALQTPDPRMKTVRRLRAEISKDKSILATERLAAHFTDYKRLYTGRRPPQERREGRADFVLIDRSDMWDTTDLRLRASVYAADAMYGLYGE
ncbi:MAG: DUF2079 domain-containing protein, partial [Planctomycetes bacterium]|nr:DUF2079 domain-containing protein [Planctomycetota bacterium]